MGVVQKQSLCGPIARPPMLAVFKILDCALWWSVKNMILVSPASKGVEKSMIRISQVTLQATEEVVCRI